MPKEQTFIPPGPLHTAVLFLIYKRPDTTKQVFEAIRQAKPPRLYVAADGPKSDVPGEVEKVQQVRDIVLNGVDWDCEVKTLFRDTNLGCKYGVSGGIDWFFENEEAGIILEDDTLPSQSFFWFCQELLERYRDDLRVWHISGDNFHNKLYDYEFSYYFSKYCHIWGWATWKNRWDYYDVSINEVLFQDCSKWLNYYAFDRNEYRDKYNNFRNVKNNTIDTWDFQWTFTVWANNGISIIPHKNLVINLGFDSEATHTKSTKSSSLLKLKKFNIHFPLKHNLNVYKNYKLDYSFYIKNRKKTLKNKIKSLIYAM